MIDNVDLKYQKVSDLEIEDFSRLMSLVYKLGWYQEGDIGKKYLYTYADPKRKDDIYSIIPKENIIEDNQVIAGHNTNVLKVIANSLKEAEKLNDILNDAEIDQISYHSCGHHFPIREIKVADKPVEMNLVSIIKSDNRLPTNYDLLFPRILRDTNAEINAPSWYSFFVEFVPKDYKANILLHSVTIPFFTNELMRSFSRSKYDAEEKTIIVENLLLNRFGEKFGEAFSENIARADFFPIYVKDSCGSSSSKLWHKPGEVNYRMRLDVCGDKSFSELIGNMNNMFLTILEGADRYSSKDEIVWLKPSNDMLSFFNNCRNWNEISAVIPEKFEEKHGVNINE